MGCGASTGVVEERDPADAEGQEQARLYQVRLDAAREITTARFKRCLQLRRATEEAVKSLGPLMKIWACGECPSDNTEPHFIPPVGPADLTQRVPPSDLAGETVFRLQTPALNVPRMTSSRSLEIDTCLSKDPQMAVGEGFAARAFFKNCLSGYCCGFVRLPKEPAARNRAAGQIRRASLDKQPKLGVEESSTTTERERGVDNLVRGNSTTQVLETRGFMNRSKPVYDTSIDGEVASPIGGLFISPIEADARDPTDVVAACPTEDDVASAVAREKTRADHLPIALSPRKLEKYFLYPTRIAALGIKLNYRVKRIETEGSEAVTPSRRDNAAFLHTVKRDLLPKDSVPLPTFYRNVAHVLEPLGGRPSFRLQPATPSPNRNARFVAGDRRCMEDCFVTFYPPLGLYGDDSIFSEHFARTENSVAVNIGKPLAEEHIWWQQLMDYISGDSRRREEIKEFIQAKLKVDSSDTLYWLALRCQINLWIIAVLNSVADANSKGIPNCGNTSQTTLVEMKLGLLPAHGNRSFLAYNGFGHSNSVADADGVFTSALPPLREFHDFTRPATLVPFYSCVSEGTFSVVVNHRPVANSEDMAPYLTPLYQEVHQIDTLLNDVLKDTWSIC